MPTSLSLFFQTGSISENVITKCVLNCATKILRPLKISHTYRIDFTAEELKFSG